MSGMVSNEVLECVGKIDDSSGGNVKRAGCRHLVSFGEPGECISYSKGLSSGGTYFVAAVMFEGGSEIEAGGAVSCPCSAVRGIIMDEDSGACGSDGVGPEIMRTAVDASVC